MRRFCRYVVVFFLLVLLGGAAAADGAVPAMTVKGLTEGIVLEFNEAPDIRVYVPDGATGLMVEAERIATPDGSPANPEEDRREWGEWFDHYRLAPCVEISGKRFYDWGTWRVTARYTMDEYGDDVDPGQDLTWTELASLDVTVLNWQERMDAPSVSLSSVSVSRGEWLRVTLSRFQHQNEWYWYELSRMDETSGEWGGWFMHTDVTLREGVTDTFTVPTLDLEAGTYRLWTRTEAVGWEDSGTYSTFIVSESGSFPDGIALSTPSVPAGVSVDINLACAGAEGLRVEAELEEDPFWGMDPAETEGDRAAWRPDFDVPGTYHLTLTAWEGEESWTVGSATLTVTAEDCLADPVYSGFPGLLQGQQDLSGTLILDSRTERYGVTVNYCPDDGDWVTLYSSYTEAQHPEAETFSLPAALFAQEGRYRVRVHTEAAGLSSTGNEYWLVRTASGTGSVTLKINGSTEDLTLNASENAWIEVTAPTATAVRVLLGDRWEYLGDPEQYRFDWRFGAGDYAVTAQITEDEPVWRSESFDWGSFRWEELNWGACSDAVKVHAKAENGRLDAPVISLTDNTVERGQWLTGSVTGQDRGERYWSKVRKLWKNEWGDTESQDLIDVDWTGEYEFRVPIVSLEPGIYYLTVHADAIGWKDAERSVPFTVTDSVLPMDAPALYFAKDSILTGQDITFYAYAPGADRMIVDVSWDADLNWQNHYEDNDEWNSWGWSCSESGTYVFTLSAWQGQQSLGTAEYTLQVSAPYGTLDQPQPEGVPSSMTAGSGIQGTVTIDSRADGAGIHLNYCPEDGWWDTVYEAWQPASGTGNVALSLPGEAFTRPGIYRLEIHVSALGYNGGHAYRQILVTEGEMQERLELIVNGGSGEDVYLHQNLPLTFLAPESVTAFRLFSSARDRWEYIARTEETFEWYWGFHEPGIETLIVQGTEDTSVTAWLDAHGNMDGFDWSQVSWTMTSGEVQVYVIKYGDLEAPNVSFPEGTTVARGQMLVLELEPVANAYSYGVQVRRADDDEGRWLVDMDYPLTETTRISVPTDGLEGGDYIVQIDPRCYGWHGDSVGYPFTVTQDGSWTGDPVFRVTPAEILTREEITFSVYAPGAEEVVLRSENEDWFRAWGESLTDHVMLNWAKTYRLEAWARYGEDWTQIGETAEVQVTAPYGSVGLSAEAPAKLRTSEDLVIQASCDFRGTNGTVSCYVRPIGGETFEPDIQAEWDEDGVHRITWQVSAGNLPVGPCFVTILAYPGAPGYEIAVYDTTVDVSEGDLEAVLTASPNPASIFDDVEVSLSVPGATAVGIYADAFGEAWIYDLGSSLHEAWTMWDEGEAFFYGVYTTEDVNPDEPGFRWEDVHWEGVSNSVLVTVNPPSGELEELDVVLESTSIQRGKKLKVTILNENPGLEVSYGATLLKAGDETAVYPWNGTDEGNDHVIHVNTMVSESGDYILRVSANAHGCRPKMKDLPVTITEAALTVLKLPAGLKTIEEEALAGTAAQKIVIPEGVTVIASGAFTDCPNLVELVLPPGISSFDADALGTSGPVYVFGQADGYLEAYAETVRNLVLIPTR